MKVIDNTTVNFYIDGCFDQDKMVRSSTNKNDYWRISRTPAIGFLFITPIWILYELLAYQLNDSLQGDLRTGVDLLITKLILIVKLPVILSLLIPAGLIFVVVFSSRTSLRRMNPAPHYFVLMFLESLVYATVFGIVVGWMTSTILTLSAVQWHLPAVASIVTHLGAGIYEEILFRFLLITGIVYLMQKVVKTPRSLACSLAVLISSLVFALFHYLTLFQEPLIPETFVFRFIGGLVFSGLFLFRGIGITVYSHSFYNILLFFRS
jgi:membrane protease YdiL (CAAX protease family)